MSISRECRYRWGYLSGTLTSFIIIISSSSSIVELLHSISILDGIYRYLVLYELRWTDLHIDFNGTKMVIQVMAARATCHVEKFSTHYNDVIMGAMASQITSLIIVYWRCSSKKTSKLRVTGLCAGNSPVTGEFPVQMASNAENVSIWRRHHAMIPIYGKRSSI